MDKPKVNRYVPDTVSPPGETLQETLDSLGMSQAELADRTGRPKKTINEIIKGKAAITPETAIQFERALGVPAHFWNAREGAYQEYLARREEEARLGRTAAGWTEQFPLKIMAERGWLDWHSSAIEQARALLNFFGVASPEAWREQWSSLDCEFRKSQKLTCDFGAVTAWLRRGEVVAQKIACAPFDKERFRIELTQIRALTAEPPDVFEPNMRKRCADAGVAFVLVPELPRLRVSGATRWLSPVKALIQMSLRYKADDHFWFTFFHESGHVLTQRKRETFIEGMDGHDVEAEAAADRFASDHLIPRDAYTRFVGGQRRAPSKAEIVSFAKSVGIAPGIVVGRLQHDKQLPFSHCNELKRRFAWKDDADPASS